MKAVLLQGFGGLEVLTVGEVEVPKPGEGQVLVKVAATTVNRPDLVQREGKYPHRPAIRRFSAWKWPESSASLVQAYPAGRSVTGSSPWSAAGATLNTRLLTPAT